MTYSVWTQLKYFRIHENWGEPFKMSGALLITLDLIRHYMDCPIVLHCGYAEDGHSNNSQHYVGNAVDFHFNGVTLEESYVKLCKILDLLQIEDRVGLGLYPDWNQRGLHLDLRGSRARWCYREGVQMPIEVAFNELGTGLA